MIDPSVSINRQCIESLGKDLLRVAYYGNGTVPSDHPAMAEYRALTAPCRERVDLFIAGAKHGGEIVIEDLRSGPKPKDLAGDALATAIVRTFDAPTEPELLARPAPTIPDAEYYAHGCDQRVSEGLREFILVMAASAIGVAFVLAMCLLLIVRRHG